MSCPQWNEQWVAKLYDELEPAEERRLEEHLAICESCRGTLDGLARSRVLLREGMGAIPAAPRAIVLRSGRPAWAFASGLAAALVVFGLGAWAGAGVLGQPPRERATVQSGPAAEETPRVALEQRIRTLEAQLAELESATSAARTEPVQPAAECVTREQLAADLGKLEQRFKYERLGDVEYLLGEMKSVERRAADWVDETREAVRLVALTSDPRLNER